MALEKALWQRVRNGGIDLRRMGHKAMLERVENSINDGTPDTLNCVDGHSFTMELKSEDRPKRESTKIRFKIRQSQLDWHRERCEAGCRQNWFLLQVGENHDARLYLVPGCMAPEIIATEAELEIMSRLDDSKRMPMVSILLRAAAGW